MSQALLNSACMLLVFGVAFWLPGRLLLDLLVPDAEPEERLPISLTLGLVAVCVTAILGVGLLGLKVAVYLTTPVMWLVVLIVILTLFVTRVWRLGWSFEGWLTRPSRRLVALFAVTAAATAFFLVHYDEDLLWEESCMVRAATAINANTLDADAIKTHAPDDPLSSYQSDPLEGRREGTNRFLSYNQGEPLGPSILIAPFLALFGLFGFRLVYALQGLLLPAAGFILGRRITGRAWGGWLTASLLTFSPYALNVRTFDENFMASAFGSVALVLLTRPRIPALAAGMVTCMLVSLRQPLVLMVPLVLAYLPRAKPGRWSPRLAFLVGMALIGLPTLIKHYLFVTYEGGTVFEGAFERPLAPHSLFGFELDLRVLLGFPFVPELVRSPYNAYPTLLAFPLDVLRVFGFLLAALVPAGALWLWRHHRRHALLFAAWVVPLMVLLLVQSNWVEPNKMGVPATVLAPMVLLVVAGIAALADKRASLRWKAACLLVGVVVPVSFSLSVRGYESTLDERVFGYPLELYEKIFSAETVRYLYESPEYVEWDRRRMRPSLLPAWPLETFHPTVLGRDVERLLTALERPGFVDYVRPMPDRLMAMVLGPGMVVGPLTVINRMDSSQGDRERTRPPKVVSSVDVTLGLAAPWIEGEPIQLSTGGDESLVAHASHGGAPLIDATTDVPTIVSGLSLPWSDAPSSLLAARDETGAVFLFLMPGVPPSGSAREATMIDGSQLGGGSLRVRVPEGEVIRLIEVRSYRPARWYLRFSVVRRGGVWLSPSRVLSPA